MSKAIIKIDIPTDYADEYKQWIIEGRLCYLEDNAWMHLKDVECKVEPYREVIPIEYIEAFKKKVRHIAPAKAVIDWLLENWEDEQARLFEKQITEECVSAERFADWGKENADTD